MVVVRIGDNGTGEDRCDDVIVLRLLSLSPPAPEGEENSSGALALFIGFDDGGDVFWEDERSEGDGDADLVVEDPNGR